MSSQRVFGTDGIRGRVGSETINPATILKLGWAVGKVLCQKPGDKVLIGKDTRISGYLMESALEAGLSSAGMNIQLVGPLPTPGVAYLTRTQRAAAGIVISASHNPYWDNGLKFFSSDGCKLTDDQERQIEAAMLEPLEMVDSADLGKAERIDDAVGRYAEFCKQTFPQDLNLNGLKIVMDCANGATYQVAPLVFSELGANLVLLGDAPDGLNINLDCGSTRPKALQNAVVAHEADLGVAFDGDGDRLIMVDHLGQLVEGDACLYVMIKHALAMGDAVPGVVGTLMSNEGIVQTLAKQDISFHRANVGDKHVLAELHARGWQLGGEPSGHLIHLGKTTTGDGLIAALQILAALVSSQASLHSMVSDLAIYPQSLVNVPFLSSDVDRLQSRGFEKLCESVESNLKEKGRILVRRSGTEPLLRVMVEAEDSRLAQKTAEKIADYFMQTK